MAVGKILPMFLAIHLIPQKEKYAYDCHAPNTTAHAILPRDALLTEV